MNKIKLFLFPNLINSDKSSLLILYFRVTLSLLILRHGIEKCLAFHTLKDHFPDPIGVGSEASLLLVIFAEVVCALGVLTGFLYRLSLIAMLFSFSVIVFVVSTHMPFGQKELPLLYLICLLGLFYAGSGRYSIDYIINKKIKNSDRFLDES